MVNRKGFDEERERIAQAVREQMPAQRWEHTLGVVEAAIMLAERYGGDRDKAELAALLHDYAKYWPIDKQRQMLLDQGIAEDLLAYDKQLWHAPAGACAVRSELGIEDQEVLDAIRYHTSGRQHMSLLDKIICLADYIERGRSFPGVERIREYALQSLEKALVAGFDSTIHYLLAQGAKIYPLTIAARNALLEQLNQDETGGNT